MNPRHDGGTTPRDAHAARRTILEREAAEKARLSGIISSSRLVTFVGAAAIAFARGFDYLPSFFWGVAAVLAALFVGLVIAHAKLDGTERRISAAIEFHKWAMLRIDGQFRAYPSRGERFRSDDHAYSSDLDLFGESSLFQLLDGTHTRRGEECLANWLLDPSTREDVQKRQAAVRELASLESMREELAVLGTLIRADKPNPDPLLGWAEGKPVISIVPWHRWAAIAGPLFAGSAFALAQMGLLSNKVLLVVLLLEWVYSLSLLSKIEPIASAVSSREGALLRYRSMLLLLENTHFESEHLQRLQKKIGTGGDGRRRGSDEIGSLSSIVGFLDARQNEVFRFFIGPLFLWDLQCVLALERWQARAGKQVRAWLEGVGELEALASLAAFAHDNPELTWPAVVEEPCFRARGLGHPLLPPAVRITNDVTLRGSGAALLVTGSNMSGKSTLLRAMGLNTVLALAGAPVVARDLEIGTVELRTSMWARDSLARGVSHFYAELEKLKRVVDGMKSGRPLFFLLDEILQGTNSRERVIGARSVLRHLLEQGAMGAISTHDVGLLDLGPGIDARVDKVHFEEQIEEAENGKSVMSFDYQLRPGVVRSTNALRLMQRVGIEVDLE